MCPGINLMRRVGLAVLGSEVVVHLPAFFFGVAFVSIWLLDFPGGFNLFPLRVGRRRKLVEGLRPVCPGGNLAVLSLE